MSNIYGKSTEIISRKLKMVSDKYPNLKLCQMEILKLLETILTNTPCIEHNKCIVNRVYRKNDISKKPIIYSYFNLNENGEVFYYIDENTSEFVKMSKEDFEKNFICYEEDLIKTVGQNPWNIKEIVNIERKPETSSGSISIDRSYEK